MTIQADVGRELNITTLIRRAYQLAGLMSAEQGTDGPQWASRSGMARDLLTVIVAEVQTAGFMTRGRNFVYQTLTQGTYTYALPDTVWDVVGNGAYIAAAETNVTAATSETPVVQRDVETWQSIGTKAGQGRPTFFMVDRSVFPLQVRVWQTPSEAGTIRFQTYRLLSNVTDGNATVDLERYWSGYLLFELAHQLACAHSLPTDKCMYFATMAQNKKDEAKKWGNQHASTTFVIEHRTGWQ